MSLPHMYIPHTLTGYVPKETLKTGQTATFVDETSSGAASAFVTFFNNGTTSYGGSTSWGSAYGNWLSSAPNPLGIETYWFRITGGGVGYSGTQQGIWVSQTTNPNIIFSAAQNNTAGGILTVDISTSGSGLPIVATNTINVSITV